MGTNKKKK